MWMTSTIPAEHAVVQMIPLGVCLRQMAHICISCNIESGIKEHAIEV